ncbi:MAG: acyl carrier protein [Candidatus Kapabacteria bacterium]|nr:acyl carrier protein [Candidatus Kapabacteria bacterium]
MNIEKLSSAFSNVLGLNGDKITDDLSYGSLGWDSVAHMKIIAAIEDSFDIMLETEDVIDMSSFKKAKEILTKYGIAF